MRQVCLSILQRAWRKGLLTRIVASFFSLTLFAASHSMADDVFIYSSDTSIRGLNLTQQTENYLTTSPFVSGLNAVAVNLFNGLVYYGSGTGVYRWDPALGSGPAAHSLMNDFANGAVQAPITQLNSTAGSFLNGKYYVGSEASNGYVQDLWELQLSADGRQVLSATALNLLDACNCTGVEIGGFGDVAAFDIAGDVVLFGSTGALSQSSTKAGRWKFNVTQGTWQLLVQGGGGQMSSSTTGDLYSNVGNQIRIVDQTTGIIGQNTLFTTSLPIYDFSSGYAIDFGDAPDSFGSAFHVLPPNSGIKLGAVAPDDEAASLNAATGGNDITGDDDAGIDDEDAVTNLADINTSVGSYSINISCTSGTPVNAWIDLNASGVFDSAERNSNYPVTCQGGQAQLTWTNIATATGGDSFIRIRTSSNLPSIAGPTGIAPDGEVEDHPVRIIQTSTGSCPAGATLLTQFATDLPLRIGPNANTVTQSTIDIPSSAQVADVNVLNVVGDHSSIRDLNFKLLHDNVAIDLYGPTCNTRDNFNFGFDDESTGTPPCPPVDGGTYPPSTPLSSFDGEDSIGDWILQITDTRNRRGGTLYSWGIEICTIPFVPENPDIILGKSATVDDREVTITMVARNSGDVDLSDVQISDNLDNVFGAGNYSLIGFPQLLSSPAGYTANLAFDGTNANSTLISGNGVVPPDGEISVVFKVEIAAAGTNGAPETYSNQAVSSALSPQDASISDLSGDGLDTSTDTDTPTIISMGQRALNLSGHVFFDVSSTASSSHDGLMDSGEPANSNRQLNVFDANSNNLLASVQTNASGFWSAAVDPALANQSIRIELVANAASLTISEDPTHTSGAVTDNSMIVIPTAGSDVTNINFGVIPAPQLLFDQSSSTTAASAVRYAHEYTVPSHGDLTVSLSHLESPTNPAWPSRVVLDNNCNGVVDNSDSEIVSLNTVIPNQKICMVVDVFAPANSVVGAIQQAHLQVNFFASDAALTGHNLTSSISNTDTTHILAANSGQVALHKSVQNISAGTPASVSNSGKPGETLEYTITYTNTGTGPIDDLVINDSAPAYTQVQSGSATCTNTPGSVSCTPGVSGDDVQWEINGQLGSGESGKVRYSVLVE